MGNLLRNDGKLYNGVGQTFKMHIQAEPVYKNLFIDSVSGFQIGQDQSGTSTARLSVTFRNNGNTAVEQPFAVTFYSDAALTTPIGTASVTPLIRGCATRSYTAEVDWSGLTSGNHQFWVLVDSQNVIPEKPAGNTDNTGSGQVEVKAVPYYTLDLQIENQGIGTGGRVTVSPDLPSYAEGTEVTLEAIPFAGWVFTGWEGALFGSARVANVTMNSNVIVKAIFTQEQYDLDLKVIGEGKVSVSPEEEKYLFGDRVAFYAQPVTGWRFISWSGEVNDISPYILINFENDVSITAKFAEIPPGYVLILITMRG